METVDTGITVSALNGAKVLSSFDGVLDGLRAVAIAAAILAIFFAIGRQFFLASSEDDADQARAATIRRIVRILVIVSILTALTSIAPGLFLALGGDFTISPFLSQVK